MAFDVSCLYSVLKNISGATRNFSYLPPHGRKLEAAETLSVFGDVQSAISRGDRALDDRFFSSLENDLSNQNIEVVSTPAVILYDGDTQQSKMLHIDSGVLAVVDPCWESSISE